MDLHQNARLTFRSRETLANQVMIEKVTLKAAAAACNVSRKTAAKWVQRYRTLGLPGLRDRSSRPLHSPRRTSSELIAQVIGLRRQLRPAYQHRPSHRPQPRHPQSHPAARSVEPLASSASRSAGRALRASRSRRSAASRHQGHDPLSAGLHSWRRPSSRPPSVRRLAGSARRHRRSLPPCLLPHAAQPAKPNRLSDNVGGVKHFSRTLQRALGEERHFALVDGFAFSNPGSLVISQVGNSVRPMHLFGRQRPIMITTSNSSVKRSGTPNQYARCSTAHHGDFRAVPRANRI